MPGTEGKGARPPPRCGCAGGYVDGKICSKCFGTGIEMKGSLPHINKSHFTDREILERLRAEFDWLFNQADTDHRNDYAAVLENLIMNRLNEAGLKPGSCGDHGVAGLEAEYEEEPHSCCKRPGYKPAGKDLQICMCYCHYERQGV